MEGKWVLEVDPTMSVVQVKQLSLLSQAAWICNSYVYCCNVSNMWRNSIFCWGGSADILVSNMCCASSQTCLWCWVAKPLSQMKDQVSYSKCRPIELLIFAGSKLFKTQVYVSKLCISPKELYLLIPDTTSFLLFFSRSIGAAQTIVAFLPALYGGSGLLFEGSLLCSIWITYSLLLSSYYSVVFYVFSSNPSLEVFKEYLISLNWLHQEALESLVQTCWNNIYKLSDLYC